MFSRRGLLCLALSTAMSATLLAGNDVTPALAKKPELKEAPAKTVTTLLEEYGKAVDAGDAKLVVEVLVKMRAYENVEFRKPGLASLSYRATKLDRKAAAAEAKGKGKDSRKIAAKALLDREEGVQIAAARLLANCPDKDTGKTLHKLLAKKEVRDNRPRLRARLMLTMGHIGYTKAWELILNELRQQADNNVMKAAVLYFGLTKEKRAAVTLTGYIDDPRSKPVKHRINRLGEIWIHITNDVHWALKEITGQDFKTTKEARDWVRDNFRL